MIRWIASGRQRTAHAFRYEGPMLGMIALCGAGRAVEAQFPRWTRCKRCLRKLRAERKATR